MAISMKKFHPGWMTPSGWTGSVTAVRDTREAFDSAPSINNARRIAYRPPIAVSLCLLALLVSYFKQTLWPCGQLWPYVGMGSLGMGLPLDCNAMGDAVKISPCISSISAQNPNLSVLIIHIIPSRQIYGAIDNLLLFPSVSCLATSSNRWNYMGKADNVSHTENMQCNRCQWFSPLDKLWDGIQVTRVFRYCGQRQG